MQNRQYEDQRGTSLTAFKEMPDFLREPSDGGDVERLIATDDEKCSHDDSRVEVCRHGDMNIDSNLQFSLSPAQCLQQYATFSDEDIPSHEEAEQYFSCNSRALSSPDYTDPKLMEQSVRDIGMESPTGSRSWTLVGHIASNPRKQVVDDSVFAVPTMPPLRIYRRRVSTPSSDSRAADCLTPQSTDSLHRPMSVDITRDPNDLSGSSSTPSPTTHDLVVVGGDCIVAKSSDISSAVKHALAPIVDPEDSGEEFGIV